MNFLETLDKRQNEIEHTLFGDSISKSILIV